MGTYNRSKKHLTFKNPLVLIKNIEIYVRSNSNRRVFVADYSVNGYYYYCFYGSYDQYQFDISKKDLIKYIKNNPQCKRICNKITNVYLKGCYIKQLNNRFKNKLK